MTNQCRKLWFFTWGWQWNKYGKCSTNVINAWRRVNKICKMSKPSFKTRQKYNKPSTKPKPWNNCNGYLKTLKSVRRNCATFGRNNKWGKTSMSAFRRYRNCRNRYANLTSNWKATKCGVSKTWLKPAQKPNKPVTRPPIVCPEPVVRPPKPTCNVQTVQYETITHEYYVTISQQFVYWIQHASTQQEYNQYTEQYNFFNTQCSGAHSEW